jgi:hypothetical protein
MILDFPLPTRVEAAAAIRQWLPDVHDSLTAALGIAFAGKSFSDAERELMHLRRSAAMTNGSLDEHLKSLFASHIGQLSKADRRDVAVQLVRGGFASQREARALTGVSRDTIRKDTRDSRRA